jgi:mono/diheme cytochrome c family protein
MHRESAAILSAAALAGLVGGIARQTRGASQIPTPDQSLSKEERARLLAKGKELFLSRCARCHGENGDKPLKGGVPLSERGLSGDVIAQAVNGRLRDGTDEERRAVTLYISNLMKTKDTEGKPASKP